MRDSDDEHVHTTVTVETVEISQPDNTDRPYRVRAISSSGDETVGDVYEIFLRDKDVRLESIGEVRLEADERLGDAIEIMIAEPDFAVAYR